MTLKQGDILQGVAVHHDQVGPFADFYGPQVLRQAVPRMWLKQRRRWRRQWRRLAQSQAAALRYDYRPRPYPARLAVFQTSRATQAAWAELAQGQLDFYVIPGSHLDIFHEPHVQQLAQALDRALRQAQE